MKKLLIVGNMKSSSLRNLIRKAFLECDLEIYVMPMDIGTFKEEFESERIHMLPIKRKSNKILYYFQLIHYLRKNEFDYINIQYVEPVFLPLIYMTKRKKTKIIATYWGSDLMVIKPIVLKCIAPFVYRFDYVTFDSMDLRKIFNDIYSKYDSKKQVMTWIGSDILQILTHYEIEDENRVARKEWNISMDKCVISIGYNGGDRQQHIKVLEQIDILSRNMKDQICIILQLTGNSSASYIDEVRKKAESLETQFLIFDDWLDNNEIARIRVVSDIFINAQITDAFALSVGEHLYAKTVLVTADWVNYLELQNGDFDYLIFHAFDEIPEIVTRIVTQGVNIDREKNRRNIYNYRSWEQTNEAWKNVFGI